MLLKIERAQNTIGWSEKDLFNFLQIYGSEREALAKKKEIDLEKERLPSDGIILIVKLAELMEAAVGCFGNKEIARGWFGRKNRALGGARPKKLISQKGLDGLCEVIQLVGRIQHGIYN